MFNKVDIRGSSMRLKPPIYRYFPGNEAAYSAAHASEPSAIDVNPETIAFWEGKF